MLFGYSALLSTFNSDMTLSNVYTYGRTISGLSGFTRCCIDTIENRFWVGGGASGPSGRKTRGIDGFQVFQTSEINEFSPPIFDWRPLSKGINACAYCIRPTPKRKPKQVNCLLQFLSIWSGIRTPTPSLTVNDRHYANNCIEQNHSEIRLYLFCLTLQLART